MSIASNLTPDAVKKIELSLKDMSDLKSKIELFQTSFNEAKKAIKEEHELSTTEITTLFNCYHKEQSEEYFEQQSDLEELYHKIFESNVGNL